MAYVRSVREIPLTEDPMMSALAAVLPDPEESPFSTELDWDNATPKQRSLLSIHPDVVLIVGAGGPSSGSVD